MKFQYFLNLISALSDQLLVKFLRRFVKAYEINFPDAAVLFFIKIAIDPGYGNSRSLFFRIAVNAGTYGRKSYASAARLFGHFERSPVAAGQKRASLQPPPFQTGPTVWMTWAAGRS